MVQAGHSALSLLLLLLLRLLLLLLLLGQGATPINVPQDRESFTQSAVEVSGLELGEAQTTPACLRCSQQPEPSGFKNSSCAMLYCLTLIVDATSESLRREEKEAREPAGRYKDLLHFLTRPIPLISQTQHIYVCMYISEYNVHPCI